MKRQKKNESLPFVLSLTLHGLLAAFLLLKIDPLDKSLLERKKNLEVELIDPEKMLEAMKRNQAAQGQIVDQSETRINEEVPKDTKYMSRFNQKVEQETQAALHGKFKNSDNSGGKPVREQKVGKETPKTGEEREEKKVAKSEEPAILESADGVAIRRQASGKPSLKDLTPSFKPGPPRVDSQDIAQGGGAGPSATDDHLKNVPTGMQTLLSTREFVYFSYYNRIKDKLRQYWEPKIKEKMERIIRTGRTIASSEDRITRIVIVLDENGTLVRVQVLGASGVKDLDDAAIEAFRAAAPFPNPPKGIVEPDGTIKIRWDFILEANNAGFFEKARMAHAGGT